MKTNTRNSAVVEKTYEGASTVRLLPEAMLRRSVLSTLLFEDTFYEDGKAIAERINELAAKVDPLVVANLAIEARTRYKLRHAPLWLSLALFEAAKTNNPVDHDRKLYGGYALQEVIQRTDELTETLAMWWKGGKRPIPNQMKKALGKAFTKFNEYALAKYNRDAAIKLKDVLFMVHATPKDEAQADLWKRLIADKLKVPDTWEVAISATKGNEEEKCAEWTRLLKEGKLGALALLRNLRNMISLNISEDTVREALRNVKVDRVFPYRFLTAVRYAPQYGDILEQKMFECLEGMPKLAGKTAILVDVSGSMSAPLSAKTETTRIEAACGLAVLARELCERVNVISFSDTAVLLPTNLRGFALADGIKRSQPNQGTYTQIGLDYANRLGYDRIFVITDEQSYQVVNPPNGKGYIMNVSPYTKSVGYGPWTRIDGWSEAALDYVREVEN